MLWSTGERNAGRVSPARSKVAMTATMKHLPTKYSGLALPNTANSATLNHQASKDVCSHLTSALKDETTFETATHTRIMAAAKAAIRTAKDRRHEWELKRITDPIPAGTKRTILRSQDTSKWIYTPLSYDNGTCLFEKWKSVMHCIFDIVEHPQALYSLRWLWS